MQASRRVTAHQLLRVCNVFDLMVGWGGVHPYRRRRISSSEAKTRLGQQRIDSYRPRSLARTLQEHQHAAIKAEIMLLLAAEGEPTNKMGAFYLYICIFLC